jgi:hypothetical protein
MAASATTTLTDSGTNAVTPGMTKKTMVSTKLSDAHSKCDYQEDSAPQLSL